MRPMSNAVFYHCRDCVKLTGLDGSAIGWQVGSMVGGWAGTQGTLLQGTIGIRLREMFQTALWSSRRTAIVDLILTRMRSATCAHAYVKRPVQ